VGGLLDEFLSYSLIILLVLSTIFSLVFITKLSNKIPESTRGWLMYPLYFGFTYLIVSLTHASIDTVMLAYVPALVAIMFDEFKVGAVVSFVKPVITLMFLWLVAPDEITNLGVSFAISWLTLLIVIALFRNFEHRAWLYYVIAMILALLENELGFLGSPEHSRTTLFVRVVSYVLIVGFMLHLKKHLVADEKAYLAELNTDALTNLYNLRAFKQDFESIDSKRNYIILIMDLDKFKKLNDTLGHSVGNIILKLFADKTVNTLGMNFSELDFKVYRFGGEELVCVIENRGSICRLSAEIQMLFNQMNDELSLETSTKYNMSVTFSGGLSSNVWFHQDHDKTFKRADELLYQAKKQGGNQIAVEEHLMVCDGCNNLNLFD